MSMDVIALNWTRRQYLKPIDLGLHSEIRHIEAFPGLFHLAFVRLCLTDWKGDQISVTTDQHPDHPEESFCEWRSVLPEVVDYMLEHHHDAWNIYGGSRKALIQALCDRRKQLLAELPSMEEDDPTMLPASRDELARLEAMIKKHKKLEKQRKKEQG